MNEQRRKGNFTRPHVFMYVYIVFLCFCVWDGHYDKCFSGFNELSILTNVPQMLQYCQLGDDVFSEKPFFVFLNYVT